MVDLRISRTSGVKEVARSVTKSHDDNVVRGHAIINQVGIGIRQNATDIWTGRHASCVGLLLQQRHNSHDAVAQVDGAPCGDRAST
jgi:hypothetical protein